MSKGPLTETAFTELYLSYHSRIYAAAFSLLRNQQGAEDITQQVFMRLWENRYNLEVDNIEGYLATMAKNAIFNLFRANAVQARYRRYLKERFESGVGNVEDLVIDRQQQDLLQQAIRDLPTRQQEAWRLSREQGLTQREIAEQMHISKDSVKELMHKASAVIKAVLGRITIWCMLVIFFENLPPQRHRESVNLNEAHSQAP